MKTHLRVLSAVAATSLLTACGGGGNNPIIYTAYGDIGVAQTAMEATYAGAAITDAAALPASGTATYTGFVGGQVGATENIIGQLSLTADFTGDDVIDGRAYNFLRDDDSSIAGELTLDNGNILDNGGNAEITASLSGDLDGIASTMSLDGNFVAGGVAIDGTAVGLVDNELFSGTFIADR